jgi:N-hydroxyarylamine O-acetyltransferase
MPLSRAELDQYCKRIGFEGTPRCDLPTLRRLHHLHPLAIPFENLDPWLGRPVSLEPAQVFNKLVTRTRGGYCFEQNLLFREVLETLGFRVTGLAARVVWNLPEGTTLPRTHMLLLITHEQRRWIADVGFGGLTLTAPLDLDSTAVQHTPHEAFRLTHDGAHHALHAEIGGEWQALYRFGLEEQMPADYAMANFYVGTHAQSRFVLQLLAGKPGAGMRHALLEGRYSRHQLGKPSEQRQLENATALRAVLQQELGIELGALPELDAKLTTLFSTNQETRS